jgi:hypothetical protein
MPLSTAQFFVNKPDLQLSALYPPQLSSPWPNPTELRYRPLLSDVRAPV